VIDRPVGVYIVANGNTTWSPAVDITRIVLGGQLVALAAIFMLGRALRQREHRHHQGN
jgi:hypothetical protein